MQCRRLEPSHNIPFLTVYDRPCNVRSWAAARHANHYPISDQRHRLSRAHLVCFPKGTLSDSFPSVGNNHQCYYANATTLLPLVIGLKKSQQHCHRHHPLLFAECPSTTKKFTWQLWLTCKSLAQISNKLYSCCAWLIYTPILEHAYVLAWALLLNTLLFHTIVGDIW